MIRHLLALTLCIGLASRAAADETCAPRAVTIDAL
jgi:hypothetical protein